MHCKIKLFGALLCCALFTLSLSAQEPEVSLEYDSLPGWEASVDHLLGALATGEISSGFLADRGFFWRNPFDYTGSAGSAIVRHSGDWKALYTGISTSALSPNTLPPHWDEWEADAGLLLSQGVVPIPVMHYRYHHFITDSVQLWQLIYLDGNGRLQDVGSRTESPYAEAEVFAAAPWQGKFYDTLQATFRLDEDLFFGNTGKTVAEIELDFGNGQGYQSVDLNENISAGWSTFGTKLLTLRITYTDNSEYISYFQVELIDTRPETGQGKRGPFGLPGYDFWPDTMPYITSGQGQNLGAVLEIEYGCGNHALTKPLIVVEGFNTPEFDRGARGLRYWDLFENLVIYQRNFNYSFPVLDELQAGGYDIVYIDFDQGTGDLRENAYVVMAAIEWVNQQKAANGSTEPNILMGFSMGGVVGRYALLEMEEENTPHEVKYYISFDSPHLGANVPLGYQYMIEHLYNSCISVFTETYCVRDQAPELEDAYNVLHRPATLQLLRYSTLPLIYVPLGMRLTTSAPIGHVYADFYDELRSRGMPAETERNIAIANGNDEGVDQGFASLDKLFDAQGKMYEVQGPLNAKYDIEVYAAPGYTTTDFLVYKGKIWHNPLGFLPPIYMAYPFEYKLKKARPYDNAPGGQYNTEDFGFDPAAIPFSFQELTENFCFIPTVSALNIESEIDNPHYVADEQTVVPQAKTNFDEVHLLDPNAYQQGGPNAPDNENHIAITPSNSDVFATWLFQDINSINILGTVHERTFNFGENLTGGASEKTTGRIVTNITVSGTSNQSGRICVNCNDKIGFTDQSSNPQANTTAFGLSVTSGCVNGGIVLDAYGILEIGTDVNKTAEVWVRNDASLHIKSGGTLIIRDGSKLILEDGAELIFEEGAQIQLPGYGSILKIQGKLTIGENADFTVSGNGRLVFDQPVPWSGGSINLTNYMSIGENTTFSLAGASPLNPDHLLIEAYQPVYLRDQNGNTFDAIDIQNGRIALHPGALLFSYSPTTLYRVKINAAYPWQRHEGFRLWYNAGPNDISFCTFEQGDPAFLAHWTGSDAPIVLENCTFTQNRLGFKADAGNFEILNSDFQDNVQSVFGRDLSGQSRLNSVSIDQSNPPYGYQQYPGVYVHSQSGALLKISNSEIRGCDEGLIADYMDVRSTCTRYEDNLYGVYVADSEFFADDEAGNEFLGNLVGIDLIGEGEQTGLYLKDGYNKFASWGSNLYIQGYTDNSRPNSDYVTSPPNHINADNNEMPLEIDYSGTLYMKANIQFNQGGTATTPVYLHIPNNLTNPNGFCTSPTANEDHPYLFSLYHISTQGGLVSGGELGTELPLKDAVEDAVVELSYGETENDDLWALERLQAILTGTLTGQDTNTSRIIRTAYKAMLMALSNAYNLGTLEHNAGEANPVAEEVENTVNAIDHLINAMGTIDSTEYQQFFTYNLDRTHAYRVSGFYDEAEDMFDNAYEWTFNYTHEMRSSYWECVCKAESEYFTGVTDQETFAREKNDCVLEHIGYSYKRSPGSGKGYRVAPNATAGDLVYYPQPVKHTLTVRVSPALYAPVQYTVSDVSGKILRSGTVGWQGHLQYFEIAELQAGVYFLTLHFDNKTEVLKVVKE